MGANEAAAPAEVSALTVYPVKSMKGISLNSALLEAAGLAGDRRFMVVGSDGRFITQRDMPALALIHTELLAGGISLSREGHGSIVLPLERTGGEIVETRVWGDSCRTIDQGRDIARWLSAAVDSAETLRIVRMAAGFTRPQTRPERLGERTHTHFADSAPLLVANEASLEALNRALLRNGEAPVPMNRFRPNITVRGLDAFREHRLATLLGPGYRLQLCHPCQRCKVTTIDQDSAQVHPHWQPYKTLAELNPMPGTKQAPAFGHNAIIDEGLGARISLGDPVIPA